MEDIRNIVPKTMEIAGQSNECSQLHHLATNEKEKMTPLTNIFYSEDLRISKILRRLIAEHNPNASCVLCKKLEIAVRSQSNASYICRSLEFLLANLILILNQCPEEALEQVANILGLIGYISRSDFPLYKTYITNAYRNSKGIQKYLMLALKTTISCDSVNLNLSRYSEDLLIVLKDYLENAEDGETFIAVSETIAEFSRVYKREFQCHFTDIVDIIIGWHLEVVQPQSLKLHCSTVLQQFSNYFLNELDFTFGLLGQFLEDIASFGEDVIAERTTQKCKQKAEIKIGCFIGAFNSVLKSLATRIEFIGFTTGQSMILQALCVITKAARHTLSMELASPETILNINDFLCLIYSSNSDTLNIANVEEIIDLQIRMLCIFNDKQKISLLFLILCVFRRLRTNLPRLMVTLVFQTTNNPFTTLQLTENTHIYKLLLKIYHEVLMIKNVPLLQEAYKHIVMGIDGTIAMLNTLRTDELQKAATAESTLTFYLAAISVLATQTSSIIGMYALSPSILELLISNCQAANLRLWQKHRTLHKSLLNMLIVHCRKNHNYKSTTRLLTAHLFAKHMLDEKSSPTSENFSLILKFLAEILQNSTDISYNILNVLLDWVYNLMEECMEHAVILKENNNFTTICKGVCSAALISPLKCASCMGILLKYSTLHIDTLESLRDVAVYMLDSFEPEIKQTYSVILARLPLEVSIVQLHESDVILRKKIRANELHHWYKSTAHFTPLRANFFKPFMDCLQFDSTSMKDSPLDEMFLYFFDKCWTWKSSENSVEYQKFVRDSSFILTSWLQYESARYCVRNKLRTTIGKPQDTFLAIEAIIMKYARILALKEYQSPDRVEMLVNFVTIQKKVHILLGFLENLEKHIYNAAEGTAFAILPSENTAKTFFRINTHTCNEWFKRISPAVNLIAQHTMQPEIIIRNSENLLKTTKFDDGNMDHTLVPLVWALLSCAEDDTLQGIYAWLKESGAGVGGKRYLWIQSAAEQAAGHKEKAIEGYMHILKENGPKMDASIRDFVIDQLFDCLYYTGQWCKMRELLKMYDNRRDSLNCTYSRPHANLDVVETIYYGGCATNSDQLSEALCELTSWSSIVENDNKGTAANFSYYTAVQNIESTCIEHIIRDKEGLTNMPIAIQQSIHNGIVNIVHDGRSVEQQFLVADWLILNNVCQTLVDDDNDFDGYKSIACKQTIEQSTILTKYLLWSLLFARQHEGVDQKIQSLYLDTSASACNEGNFNFCTSLLERFFELKGHCGALRNVCGKMEQNKFDLNIEDTVLLRGLSELAKCIHVNPVSQQNDAINFASAYCSQIIEIVGQSKDAKYPETSANMLLTMAEWLAQRSSTSIANSSPQLQHLLSKLPDIDVLKSTEMDADVNMLLPCSERAVGKLINASLLQNNDSGEAWCAFGNWCYRWGKKLVEAKNAKNRERKGNLSARDLAAIRDVLGGTANIKEELMNQLVCVLNNHQLNISDTSMDDIETNELSSTELLESELRKIDALASRPSDEISSIIRIWRQAHKSTYIFYETATNAYFKYLAIEAESKHMLMQANESNLGNGTFVTTTLRLLRLIVKHAIGLQEVLEEGLRTTPLRPWKVIIPQLFSRLNHHEPYVRKSVSELLCRLAQDQPHLVIFPAVVGAQQELRDANDEGDVDVSEDNKHRTKTLSTCFSSLLTTLSKQSPETVLHVQLLVKELKRITLLWEEYWIHSLAQLYAEYSSLFSAFETEFLNTKNHHLNANVRAKYEIIMKHVTADLRRIARVSEKNAETVYERSFQDRYLQLINQTFDDLKRPVNEITKPSETWLKIKQLYNIFHQRSSRASASTLKVSELSPVLANMRHTAISMPGVDTFEKNSIYIKSVDSTIYILPTKTKPKKLTFHGSDGKKYTYLFKGLEDLHLDERIMQFLSISNSMMARTSALQHAASNCYRAHHYSVIPLGPQSGLISWVDGVTPLFAIYKKWQQRDLALKQQNKERQSTTTGNTNTNAPQPQQLSVHQGIRPSEVFYNKLTPLLTEKNIKVTDPRKQWPLGILRRVLDELTKETPKDLLAKELWCNSINANDWRKSVRNYSKSVAVMSVIGYVIGLGDRHLDNVLIKLSSGEIVHIDYNVCFEKGKTLRVPEKVPFRLTPNIEEALGITGVEGAFRLGCEHVLKTLRKERETLLTLLEAFVYDPLVDWTVSDDGTSTSCITSVHAAIASIAKLNVPALDGMAVNERSSDFNEKKQNWEYSRQSIQQKVNDIIPLCIKYKAEIVALFSKINNEIERFATNVKMIHNAEQERSSLIKQLAMIRELQALGSAMGSHPLNTITQRYNTNKNDTKSFDSVKQCVQKYYDEIQIHRKTYFQHVLCISHTNQLMIFKEKLCEEQQCYLVHSNEFEVVREAMKEHVPMKFYAQCDFARNEMDTTLNNVSHAALQSTDLLLQYASVMQFYPRSQLGKSRLLQHEQWHKHLINNEEEKAVAALEQMMNDETETIARTRANQTRSTKGDILKYSSAMESIWSQLNLKLRSAMSNLNKQEQVVTVPLEITLNAITQFMAVTEINSQAIISCILPIIAEANKSFLLFEQNDPSATTGNHLLDYQIDFINMILQIDQTIFNTDVTNLSSSSANVEVLLLTLKSLHKLQSAFELSLTERIVQFLMLDDNRQLQSILDDICDKDYDWKLSEGSDDSLNKLHGLVLEIYTLFNDFEAQLQHLKISARNVLTQHMDGYYKKNVESSNMFVADDYIFCKDIKYNIISQVFSTARDHVRCLIESNCECIYDIRAIILPIWEYINHVQSTCINGLISLFVNELVSNINTTTSIDDKPTLDKAQELCSNFFMAHTNNLMLKKYQVKVLHLRKWIEHYTFISTAHVWCNEQLLSEIRSTYGHIIHKDKLLDSVKGANQLLVISKEKMQQLHIDMERCAESVSEFLKSHNLEKNQYILAIQEKFQQLIHAQKFCYNFYLPFCTDLIEYSDALLHFEKLSTCDTADICNMLKATLQQWQEASSNKCQSDAAITPTEEAIVQLLDPEGKVDQCWLENIIGLLDEMTFSVQRKLENLEREKQLIQESVYAVGQNLQSVVDNPLRTELRHILKSISKNERSTRNDVIMAVASFVRELQYKLKLFHTKLSELQMQIIAKSDYTDAILMSFKEKISELLNSAVENHTDLLQLQSELSEYEKSPARGKLDSNNSNSTNNNSSKTTTNNNSILMKVSNQCAQKRNAYAVSVWKRIRMKLEGRDPDPNHRSTIAEQVDYIIQEARNPDNLAVLYEGWTPWV